MEGETGRGYMSLSTNHCLCKENQEAGAEWEMDILVLSSALPCELDHLSSAEKTAQLRCAAENRSLIALMLRWLRAECISTSKLLNTKASILIYSVPI